MLTLRARLVAGLLVAGLLTVGLATAASAVEDETDAGFEIVLRGTNDYRQQNSQARLVHDPRLTAVAQAWAEQMAADSVTSGVNAAFRHNPNMSSQVPAGWESVGENIAWNLGFAQPYDKALEQWRNSPGHNANMLNSRWTHLGIGVYKDAGGRLWAVQVFGDYGDPATIPDPVDALVDLDSLVYSGTVQCVVLVIEPSDSEFFRQCGSRSGNEYQFSDIPPGTYSATLLAAGGAVLLSNASTTVAARATFSAVSPGFGPTAGGTVVTITGSGFTGATQVTFDGVPGTGLSVASATQLTVTTPPSANVRAPIVVTTPVGKSLATTPAFFAYTDSSIVAGVPASLVDVSNFTAGVVRCYQVTGKAGVPVGATGVVLNVTASLPNGVGHVRVYPDYLNNGASPAPAVSTVNFEVNRDVANSTTIALPSSGKVCAYSVGGTMSRLILDVTGYLIPGSGVVLTTPQKLIDTRPEAHYHVGPINGPVEPMTDYTVQVTGNAGVPAGADAVIVNITVVDTRSPGHLRMWAAGEPMPNTSVVNYAPETKANSQIVDLSADGKLTFRSFSFVPSSVSPVQVLIDVTGYIEDDSDFVATAPTTIVETRPAYTPVGLPGAPLNPNTVYSLHLSNTTLVPTGATAVVLNVTAVQPTNFGHIRVYPDTNGLGSTPPPNTSNLNFIPGRDIPNMVIVQLPPSRRIDFYTAYAGTGRTDLKVDLIGYVVAPD